MGNAHFLSAIRQMELRLARAKSLSHQGAGQQRHKK